MKPHPLETRFRKALMEQAARTPGGTVLAALSGGLDSTVLLHLLHRLAPGTGLKVAAAHLHHGLRGAAADADQRFCEELCADLSVPLISERRLVEKIAGESPQEAARRVRYTFLREAARHTAAACIATGHHADDQLETVLWRLATGADPARLSGIAPRVDDLWRPLLDEPRATLAAWAREHGITHVEDASNGNLRYTRNRIRHKVVPELAAINRSLSEAVGQTARGLAEDADFLDGHAREAWRDTVCAREQGIRLDSARLSALHPALARRVARRALREAGQPEVHHRHVAALLALATGSAGHVLDLPGVRAASGYGEITLCPASGPGAETGAEGALEGQETPLNIPGDTLVPWAGITLRARFTKAPPPGAAVIDPSSLDGPLTVRTRRSGDRIHPAGMNGHGKKLKDFFMDARVPRAERDRIPLVTCPKGVIWVVGMRQDARFMVKGSEPDAAGAPRRGIGLRQENENPVLALQVCATAAVM